MELRHLRYFVAVAEELHFTRAAERLHIGQPPLSQQIQALEAELGVTLFTRTKRRVALTEAGRHLLDRARAILAAAGSVGDEVQRIARGDVGELRIGFTTTLPLTPIMSTIVQDYHLRYPDVTLRLFERYTDDQFVALNAGRLDIGFVRFDGSHIPAGIDLIPLRHDPLMLIVPAGHRFASRTQVALSECSNEGFVTFPQHAGTGLKGHLWKLCARAGFVPHVAQEAGEGLTQIALVAAGLGVTVLPAPFDLVRVEGVRFIPLSDVGATLMTAVAVRAGDSNPRVRNWLAQLSPLSAEAS